MKFFEIFEKKTILKTFDSQKNTVLLQSALLAKYFTLRLLTGLAP
jgi:hypothetical protein